ncbi:MAG: hypothetical protein E7055_08195 [Lentisphaerae bacterium]|nr:hypothetical protein [Lentisphaerota bacterium]
MEIFAIPAVLICLLYLIFQSVQDKKSPVITLLCIALFVGLTAFTASLYAAVRASYGGQLEWAVERAFFLGRFADKLTETGDLKTAAEFMQSEAVKEQTLRLIRQIVLSFRPKTIFYLSAGGLILLLSAVSLWIKRIAGNRFYPFMLVFFVLGGGILLNLGVYYRQYASGTDRRLKTILRLQQTCVMKELAEMKTDRSIPEIIQLTRKAAGKSKGYDYGNSLPEQLRKKDKGGK